MYQQVLDFYENLFHINYETFYLHIIIRILYNKIWMKVFLVFFRFFDYIFSG